MTKPASLASDRSGLAGRLVLAALWLSLSGVGFVGALLWPHAAQSAFVRLSALVLESGLSGLLLAAFVFTSIATTGIVPASLVGLAAGALYGIAGGIPLATLCTLAGAALSFWLSRSVLRPAIAASIERRARWRRFDSLIAADSWRLVGLLRVSPVMPFAATSFALGLSSIEFWPYLGGTMAALPALFGLVALGSAAGGVGLAGVEGFGLFRLVLLGIGGVATILVSARLGRSILAARDGNESAVPERAAP